jgi:hypothetical protein
VSGPGIGDDQRAGRRDMPLPAEFLAIVARNQVGDSFVVTLTYGNSLMTGS